MEDIKKKFKSLIKKQDSVSTPLEENISHELFDGEPAVAKFKYEAYKWNPQEDQEIIEGIETVYYETTDPSLCELEKLPKALNLEEINDDRTRLRKQLQAVSKRVSELVLQNHPAYAAELQRVMELQKTLQIAMIICRNGRGQLSKASHHFTSASLHLLANVRKRQQMKTLLKSLHTIKTLQRTDVRLREMMEEGDYCGAIQLCQECQEAAATFKHYKCISELSSKLQDTLELIEEQLDFALSKVCTKFDKDHYEKLQMAYTLLGKRQINKFLSGHHDIALFSSPEPKAHQTAMDQLHLHYTSAIHNAAFQIVLGYVELCSGSQETNFNKMQFGDLCKHVTIESFTPCFVNLCKALWEVMKSYYQTIQWHDHQEVKTEDSIPSEETFSVEYMKQKLEHGLVRIWQDVQQKVRTYILGINLAAFKLEEFIQFLDLANRMIDIGDDFCQSKSEGLQDSLKQQSLNYFKNHHRSKLDELRMFLENEGWELCPVKSTFHILNLVEFKFLRKSTLLTTSQIKADTVSPDQGESVKRWRYFKAYQNEKTPFEVQIDTDEKEDVFAATGNIDSGQEDFSDSDSDIPDELKHDFIDELTGETHNRPGRRKFSRSRSYQKNVSIVTNTSLNVFRVIGKYIQMMRLLKPIAFDVMTCMAQLFDFYMYTVYNCFGSELSSMDDGTINNRLKTTLQRIYENLIAEPDHDMEENKQTDRIPKPSLSPTVELHSPQRLYGLAERIVAAESLSFSFLQGKRSGTRAWISLTLGKIGLSFELCDGDSSLLKDDCTEVVRVFLAQQMEFLQAHLEAIIPQNKKAFLQQFYSQTVNMAVELRKPVYWSVSSRIINYDIILQYMASVKWDIKDIMSQHNSYVDAILKNFAVFNTQLADLHRHLPIPRATYDLLWEQILRISSHTLVEGFAAAKKCSIEGRALMQLDFQQYLKNVEKLIDIRPIPEREYVENYVKAYYLPENQLEDWLPEHKEYSIRQLLALVGVVDHLNRKSRQRLITMVEDMDRPKR